MKDDMERKDREFLGSFVVDRWGAILFSEEVLGRKLTYFEKEMYKEGEYHFSKHGMRYLGNNHLPNATYLVEIDGEWFLEDWQDGLKLRKRITKEEAMELRKENGLNKYRIYYQGNLLTKKKTTFWEGSSFKNACLTAVISLGWDIRGYNEKENTYYGESFKKENLWQAFIRKSRLKNVLRLTKAVWKTFWKRYRIKP
jgi:hypothetical protein